VRETVEELLMLLGTVRFETMHAVLVFLLLSSLLGATCLLPLLQLLLRPTHLVQEFLIGLHTRSGPKRCLKPPCLLRFSVSVSRSAVAHRIEAGVRVRRLVGCRAVLPTVEVGADLWHATVDP